MAALSTPITTEHDLAVKGVGLGYGSIRKIVIQHRELLRTKFAVVAVGWLLLTGYTGIIGLFIEILDLLFCLAVQMNLGGAYSACYKRPGITEQFVARNS